MKRILATLVLLLAGLSSAQSWSECSAIVPGGKKMVGNEFSATVAPGQSVVGLTGSASFLVLLGFWVPECQSGVQSQEPAAGELATKLDAPAPNPLVTGALVRYTLAHESNVRLVVHDLSGRVVRTLVNRTQDRGTYRLRWSGQDDRGRTLANGVYFLRLLTSGQECSHKLLIAR